MTISLIVAAATNNAIGHNGQLPWHLPADMRFFKNTTWGMPVIMGRKTYDALGKPLSGRLNIVITRDPGWQQAGVRTANSLEQAVQIAKTEQFKETFVIGGGEIYRQAISIADQVYLTRVHTVAEGDAFFPELDPSEWQLVHDDAVAADDKHAYAFNFQRWQRQNLPAR
jgi:dihydrofolate reductase